MRPVSSTFYSWGGNIKGFVGSDMEKKELKERVDELEETVDRLRTEKHRLGAVEQENEELRGYLDFVREKEFDHVLAEVISTALDLESGENKKSVLIDKGEDSGINKGAIVVNNEGIVVGKVSETNETVSKVEFLTNEECSMAVTIQGEDRVMGVSEGQMGLTVVMQFIPQTENIQKGDIVVTSGLEKDVPPGLVVGKVAEVHSQSNEVWQSVDIEPLADLNELTNVAVVRETE